MILFSKGFKLRFLSRKSSSQVFFSEAVSLTSPSSIRSRILRLRLFILSTSLQNRRFWLVPFQALRWQNGGLILGGWCMFSIAFFGAFRVSVFLVSDDMLWPRRRTTLKAQPNKFCSPRCQAILPARSMVFWPSWVFGLHRLGLKPSLSTGWVMPWLGSAVSP